MSEQAGPATGSSTAVRGTEGDPRRTALARHVLRQVGSLQEGYLADAPWAVAALAKLRRGVGKQPGELIELAQWTAPGLFVADSRSDRIASEEWAAHIAITLYARHQQSHRDQRMHRAGRSLGDAARRLRIELGEHGEAGVLRRFNAMGTATDFSELVRHARGLIDQFRANGVWLDYALFADDLRKLMDPASAALVRNRWGRHFHRPGRSAEASAATDTDPAD